MKVSVRNNAKLSNKYVRFIKWRFYRIRKKFKNLLYVEVFLNTEGHSPKTYIANVRLGIPGDDIIIQNKSKNLTEVLRKTHAAVHRYLAKHKELNTSN